MIVLNYQQASFGTNDQDTSSGIRLILETAKSDLDGLESEIRKWYSSAMNQESLKIPNSKGQNIAAVLHRPETESDKLAVLCPGFLDTKDYAHLVALADLLCAQGYAVVRFDPTGTWESEGDISEYTTTQYLSDIRSVIDFMLEEKDYSRIMVGGHSRGGQMSLLYAARDTRVSSVVAIMPSSERTFSAKRTEQWKQDGFKISSRDIPNSEARKEFKVPYSHVEDKDTYFTTQEVKKIHTPALFIAGEQDDLVLPEYVQELFDLANEPKKFILMKGIGHDYRHSQVEIDQVNAEIISNLV